MPVKFPTIPPRCEVVEVTDKQCPFCLAKDVWLFQNLDNWAYKIRCNHCGFGMEYLEKKILFTTWDLILKEKFK